MRHFFVYDKDASLVPTERVHAWSQKRKEIKESLHNRVWMVYGEGPKHRRRYRLGGSFIAVRIDDRSKPYATFGPENERWLQDPIAIDHPKPEWFAKLMHEQKNFKSGMFEIKDPKIVAELERLLAASAESAS